MFTNKKDLKKYINRMGLEVAEGVLPAAVCAKIIAEDKAHEILNKLATIKTEALSRMNIAFDKTQKEFESEKKYRAARKAYFVQAYTKLLDDYEKGVENLLNEVNSAVPEK